MNINIQHIKKVESEVRRINRIIKKPDFNPLDIFNLSLPFSKKNLRKEYFKIIRLIHPDKSFNNERFNDVFTIVNINFKLLHNPQKEALCVKAKEIEKKPSRNAARKNKQIKHLIKQLYSQNISTNSQVNTNVKSDHNYSKNSNRRVNNYMRNNHFRNQDHSNNNSHTDKTRPQPEHC